MLRFPPTSEARCSPAAAMNPSNNASRASTDVSGGTPRFNSAKVGAPPMAATSLALTANALRPRTSKGAHPGRKWTPSIRASVVSTVVPGSASAAQSSPTSRRTCAAWQASGRRARSRRRKANSPTSRMVMAA